MQRSNDRRRRGVEGYRIFQEIRPGAGFETGDFVQEKLGGGYVVVLRVGDACLVGVRRSRIPELKTSPKNVMHRNKATIVNCGCQHYLQRVSMLVTRRS